MTTSWPGGTLARNGSGSEMFGKVKAVILFSLGIAGATLIYFVDNSQAEAGRRPVAPTRKAIASEPVLTPDALLAAPTKQNVPDLQDPLAFLEGPSDCEVVKLGIARRYGVTVNSNQPREATFREEFRHLSRFTCQNNKFSQCGFSWCVAEAGIKPANEKIARSLRMTAAEIERELAEKLSRDQSEAAKISRARLSAPAVEERALNEIPAAKAELVRVALRAPAEEAPKSTEHLGLIAEAQAEARGGFLSGENAMNAHFAQQAEQDGVLKIAEEKLQELVLQKNSEREVIQTAKIATETKKRVGWLKIVVPGSERLPRPRPSAADLAGSQAIGGSNGGRAIAPSVGSSAVSTANGAPPASAARMMPPAGYQGEAPRPVDPITAERDRELREAYRQALDDAAKTQRMLSSGVMKLTP